MIIEDIKIKLIELQERINYRFVDVLLLLESLTHPSYTREQKDDEVKQSHNQRLEFLGDSVLGLVLAKKLYELYPDVREGKLTQYRSMLVNGDLLVVLAKEINLGQFLLLSEQEEKHQGRDRKSSLEDAYEAMIGAIYLDGGMDAVSQVLFELYGDIPSRLAKEEGGYNPKGRLQETVYQADNSMQISYETVNEEGKSHEKVFTVILKIDDVELGRGSGLTKKEAEEIAASQALASLDEGNAELED
jgi:ribonuclease III